MIKLTCNIVFLSVVLVALASCCIEKLGGCTEQCGFGGAFEPILKKMPSEPNATDWEFSADAEQIRSCLLNQPNGPETVVSGALIRVVRDGWYLLEIREGKGISSLAESDKQAIKQSFYLSTAGVNSSTFFRCEKPLLVQYTFGLNLHEGEKRESVRVDVSLNSSSARLYKKLDIGVHQPYKHVYATIPSDGVFEYAILRTIGECLGVADQMPPLHLPEGPLVPCPECPQGLVGD